MNYGQQVLQRLLHPAMLLLLAGVLLVYRPAVVGRLLRMKDNETAQHVLRLVGLAALFIAAFWFFQSAL